MAPSSTPTAPDPATTRTLKRTRIDEVSLTTVGASVDLFEAVMADGTTFTHLVETSAAAKAARARKDPVGDLIALPDFWPLVPSGPDLIDDIAWERIESGYRSNEELWLSTDALHAAIAANVLDDLRIVHISPFDNGFWAPDGELPLNRVTWLDRWPSASSWLTAEGMAYLLAHPCIHLWEPTGRYGDRTQMEALGVKLPDDTFAALCAQVTASRKHTPGLYRKDEVHKGETPTPSEISALIWGTAMAVAGGKDPSDYASDPLLVDPLGLAPFMEPSREETDDEDHYLD